MVAFTEQAHYEPAASGWGRPGLGDSARRSVTGLYGRDEEISRIEAMLHEARASRSNAIVIRGVAGAGKSALLDVARSHAQGMSVLTSTGVESETELPFSALHQLVRPILSHIDVLPDIQARALRVAFGLAAGASDQRFLVSVATLSLLAEGAEERPVLCLIDDAHWLDDASTDALLFVARRLGAEGIAMLFTAREGEGRRFSAPALPELHLAGLDAAAAAQLLTDFSAGELSPDLRGRLISQTAGNPLALRELISALSEEQMKGIEPVLGPLPVPWRVEQAFLARARRLPEATQMLMLVAAADDSGELAVILKAATRLGIRADAFDPAERADLVRVRDGRLEFRHPLVRSAIYHGAPVSRRQAAHAALSEVFRADVQADRRAWHRAATCIEPDPGVVAELEEAAHRARDRGAFSAASLALERAAALTVADAARAAQLAAAGEDAWIAGRPDRAAVLLERARMLAADPLLRADVDRVRGLMGINSGSPADAGRLLLTAAADVAPCDPQRALHLLSLASLAATYACDAGAIVQIGEFASALRSDQTRATRLLTQHLGGLGAYYAGEYGLAAPRLRGALELVAEADEMELAQYGEIFIIAASVGLFLGDDDVVREMHRRMVTRARASGALGHLTWALPRLAVSDIWAGRWSSASAGLTEALELSQAIGQHGIASYNLSELAIVAALRGQEDVCRARAAQSLELAGAHGLRYTEYIAHTALVALDLGLGRVEDALRRARSVTAMPGLDFWDALDRIEAAVRAGHPEVAARWLEPFHAWAQSSGSAWARGVALHCRALLADGPAQAERLYIESLAAHAQASRPFERARAEFAFGEFLRRTRRRIDARVHLRAALDTFERLGAQLWAERARTELRASGQTARKRDPSTIDDLTAQELQIAERVGRGLTNRAVAAELFVSPRTIDFHLRNIFRKLGITTRTELARMDLQTGTAP